MVALEGKKRLASVSTSFRKLWKNMSTIVKALIVTTPSDVSAAKLMVGALVVPFILISSLAEAK